MIDYPEILTREDEVKYKAETLMRQIAPLTRRAMGWRNASYRTGEGFDVAVTAKVLRANRLLEIVLELNDTYTVRLIKVPTTRAKDLSLKTLDEVTDVYAESLSETCYRLTHS